MPPKLPFICSTISPFLLPSPCRNPHKSLFPLLIGRGLKNSASQSCTEKRSTDRITHLSLSTPDPSASLCLAPQPENKSKRSEGSSSETSKIDLGRRTVARLLLEL
ncbi:hypothetical protein SKAU_G00048060 [Synaphobranchus kaupii]|uniref:Uncharacterized protein n=1 Tax=Synaphobranchus kaupii TaxID=118154 RepID=A0A9Q1G3B1_SYNKA|nr:hypothetical protein SKAU_G00048060 [Synaphobranchus kaupii]